MRKYLTLLVLPLFTTITMAQNDSSIGSSIGLYIFPGEDQDQEQQDTDELTCFNWAKKQTGYDPMNPTQVQAAQVDTSPDGAAVKGSMRGAAGGAAIGAIAGDTGKGAAIGAVVGGLRGRRAKMANDSQQQAANNAGADAYEQKLADDYKKAFSACMEAKGYTVK
jgi:hypothetical protein